MWKKCKEFIVKETVLVAAALLAAVSVCFVPVSKEYAEYIDWRTLGILLALMLVMAGFQKIGVFRYLGICLLKGISNTRQLGRVLVYLCFFSSMFITNDVALLTFVPFAIQVLKMAGQEKHMIPVVVLQTVAANLGSMLTPVGNPQNLYLYTLSGMGLFEFLLLLLPVTMAAFVLISLCLLLIPKEAIGALQGIGEEGGSWNVVKENKWSLAVYGVCFFLCLLTVAKLVPWAFTLGVVCGCVWKNDLKIFKNVDYCLLLTFIFFFIFTGNMSKIPAIHTWLQQVVTGHELLASVLCSQCISNVPAALLLSGFTENVRTLIVGVNVGGLGTLIASMASLISYKLYVAEYCNKKGKYLAYFTGISVVFLVPLLLLCMVLGL